MKHVGLHLCVVAAGLLASVGPALGDRGRADLVDVVYSNQFTFNPAGHPVVRVGLADGLQSLTFGVEGRALFLPEGVGGPSTTMLSSGPWTVSVENGKPALIRNWVSVERISRPEGAQLEAATAVWRTRGFPAARSHELGTVFGFSGEVTDTRFVELLVAPSTTAEAAQKIARVIEKRYGGRPVVRQIIERVPEGVVKIRSRDGGVVQRAQGVFWVAPANGESRFKIRSVRRSPGAKTGAGQTDPGRRSYRGALYFAVDSQGSLAVANAVGSEALVEGLVPAEIYTKAHPAALKVQAVTARNEVLAKAGIRHLRDPYLLCDDVHCQVYPGAGKERAATTAAVRSTAGEMLFLEGRLLDTRYSASCGGHSEDNHAVWPMPVDPALSARMDAPRGSPKRHLGSSEEAIRHFIQAPPRGAYCQLASLGKSHFRWRRRLSARRIDALVAKKHALGKVEKLEIIARGEGGRITRFRVVGSRGEVELRSELSVRRLLGGLKSGFFVMDEERDASGNLKAVTFHGGGFGHGVGMCQVGAIGRAEAGQDYKEILRHYYGGATVRKIY